MTTATTATGNVLAPDPSEERALHDLGEHLDEIAASGGAVTLVGPDGEEIAIPARHSTGCAGSSQR